MKMDIQKEGNLSPEMNFLLWIAAMGRTITKVSPRKHSTKKPVMTR